MGNNGSDEMITTVTSDIEGIALNQYISIGQDNSIILYNHRPEMGQGTYQSIPMILAEELGVAIDKVIIRQSEADRERYGSQMVVGSSSIRSQFDILRKMGASVRELFKKAAANRWEVDIEECTARNGSIVRSDGEILEFGALVEEAGSLDIPENPPLKSTSEFEIIGRPVPRRDIPMKTNGEAIFGMDISVPGMLYASVERSPVFLGTVVRFDTSETMKVPGVKHVFKTSRQLFGHTIEGVAVLADHYWAAVKGRNELKIEWDNKDLDEVSSQTLLSDYYRAANNEGDTLYSEGNLMQVFKGGQQIVEAAYETPYQAHIPMEPMNAIVDIKKDSAEFWGSTQNPNGIRSFLADKYNLPEDRVKINYTFMGGGFGRRSRTDVVEEAADLSAQANAPVKVIWTREDDQTQGPFRACSLNVCKAVLASDGKIEALEHKVIAQEIRNQTGDNMTAGTQLMGGITTDYRIPHFSIKGVLQKKHIPISYWRAVYHSTNPFAHECFIDELAHKASVDPLTYRLNMLDNPRFIRVLKEVGKATDWYAPRPEGVGKGIAMAERSGAHFAMVAEVMQKDNSVVPTKITTVLDLGICVNPDTVRAQTEGSIIMGLGAALAGLTVKNGAIAEQNFDTYPMLKYSQCPDIETIILESDAPPDGAGESGLPTVAPALSNAIFDLTGKRARKLPMDLDSLV